MRFPIDPLRVLEQAHILCAPQLTTHTVINETNAFMIM